MRERWKDWKTIPIFMRVFEMSVPAAKRFTPSTS
jgi:hypothetical protein